MNTQIAPIEVAPLQSDGELCGFLLVGRWPESTIEWTRVLTLAVRVAAAPAMLATTTIFRVREDVPTEPDVGAVGAVLIEGTLSGSEALSPGELARPHPAGLMVLHPPSETRGTLREVEEVASGCVLLPGLPHLGLEHRAGWVQATAGGTITSMSSRSGFQLDDDEDTAVLGMLMAA